jgi:hypothetical protein
MQDGGMGSLILATDESLQKPGRRFGRMAAELQFNDADGVAVLASLAVDQYGNLLELDLWKTDFSALIRIPEDV